MSSYALENIATEQNFDESAYLLANPDVAAAVTKGHFRSGRQHFDIFGKNEKRSLRWHRSKIAAAKKKKLEAIKPLLRKDMPNSMESDYYDFLTEDLKEQFKIIDTDAISSNNYGPPTLDMIKEYETGWILDCGAGRRSIYFDNVINLEIAAYDTTDVRGVGEKLPFIDQSFDAVLSIAVLEHVKDPFLCAKEITRILKPGGSLMCCVPFLQPFHGYPHHYYNMSYQGLKNLFEKDFDIKKIDVPLSVLPIWSLTWIIRSWSEGLKGKTKTEFLNLRLADLMEPSIQYLDRSFVKELSLEKNLELASATVLFGNKK